MLTRFVLLFCLVLTSCSTHESSDRGNDSQNKKDVIPGKPNLAPERPLQVPDDYVGHWRETHTPRGMSPGRYVGTSRITIQKNAGKYYLSQEQDCHCPSMGWGTAVSGSPVEATSNTIRIMKSDTRVRGVICGLFNKYVIECQSSLFAGTYDVTTEGKDTMKWSQDGLLLYVFERN